MGNDLYAKHNRCWSHDRVSCLLKASLVVVLLSVTACSVGPRYHAPQMQLQPFHTAPALQARRSDVPAPALDTWWEGFHDPELTRIVQRALAQNLDLAASLTRVEQARAVAKEAGARLKPSGALTAQSDSFRQSLESPFGRYGAEIPGFVRNQSYLDLGISATWEIDLFGGLRRGVEAATDEFQAAQAEGIGTRVTIVAEAADAYMQIRGTQARLAVAKEQIGIDEHLLKLVSQRRAAEIASDREQAQAEAVLFQARAIVPQLQIILEAQLNRLDVLMGAQPGTYAAELATPAEIPVIPSITLLSDPSDLLRRRPDVIAAERRVAASNARIGQALAEYYPKISLSGFLGNEAISPGNLFRGKGFQPSAVAGLQWRLFDFGRVDAEVKRARGANAEALLDYRKSVLRAAEDVEDSFTLLGQSEMRGDEILREIASLQRVRDRSQEAYQAGVIPLTDVLDADRQLLVARDDLALTRETAAQAAVGSFRALGGGWTP
ncbi:MAG TPA: efflux transporter outer membrane subunit [Acidobacteriaceae bacterium]|nr:efflux transporter outer membrane subunit [Acidobacteriaceae bacterium]